MPEAGAACRARWIISGFFSISLRQLQDLRRHRRAEEQRLPLLRHVPQDPPDVGQEAHVEHAVGFVEDEILEMRELGVRRAQVVEQPPGRRDHDVDPGAERVLLRPHRDAAEHRRAGERRVDRERVELLEDLRGELARRREHQRARPAARLVHQRVQDRQQECRGLAAAGLRAGEHVASGHRRRDRVGLHRGRTRQNRARVMLLSRLG